MAKLIDREVLEGLAASNRPRIPKYVDDSGRRMRWAGDGWADEGPTQGDEEATVRGSLVPEPIDIR